jgi:acyl-coenzyme A thioesterase PaaI-like protein
VKLSVRRPSQREVFFVIDRDRPFLYFTMATMKPNGLLRIVNRINGAGLPDLLRRSALTLAFNTNIKYAGTTGIGIEHWDLDKSIVHLKNRKHIQNHIGGIHATAMATLAESTTGMLFGLYVPDTHLPLLKSMKVSYVARATGNLKAVATLTDEQKDQIQTTDRGSVVVPVTVTDSDGKEPIQVEMEWAWTTKKKKDKDANNDENDQLKSKL